MVSKHTAVYHLKYVLIVYEDLQGSEILAAVNYSVLDELKDSVSLRIRMLIWWDIDFRSLKVYVKESSHVESDVSLNFDLNHNYNYCSSSSLTKHPKSTPLSH